MTRKPIIIWFAAVFLLLAGFGTPSIQAEGSFKKLTLLPQWRPQAQFVGYYMALHKGFYERCGISLTILEGGPQRPATEYLADGKADLVTLWLSSALQLADRGTAVVNVGQLIQRSGLMLASKKRSGIKTPADMEGKKISLWPGEFEILPRALFEKFDLRVREVITECPVSLFLRDGVQVVSLMWYNEYHTLIMSGLDPEEMTLFFYDEVGLNFPEDGMYLLRETFEKDPETAYAFAAASLEGWRYAFDHPGEAVDLIVSIMEEAHLPANRVHQRWMLDRIRDLSMDADGGELHGVLLEEDYRTVADTLSKTGRIRTAPAYELFFKKEGVSP